MAKWNYTGLAICCYKSIVIFFDFITSVLFLAAGEMNASYFSVCQHTIKIIAKSCILIHISLGDVRKPTQMLSGHFYQRSW